MPRLVFNHAHGNAPKPVSLLLGLVLLIGLGVLFGLYRQANADNEVMQRQLEVRRSVVMPVSGSQSMKVVKINPAQAAEIAEAQANIQTPWIPLLHDLEQAHQPNLYWMQLSPDVKHKHIRMTVLANNRQQGWALVDSLKKQTGLADVKLKSSESSEVNGLVMTTLHLEAGWKF